MMAKIRLYILFYALFIFGCSSIAPLTKDIPVTSGAISKVNFDSTPGPKGENQDFKIQLLLHQYENCDFIERGRVILEPETSYQSYNFRSGSLLFAEIVAAFSWRDKYRSDIAIPLEDSAEYILKIDYDEEGLNIVKVIVSMLRKDDGRIEYLPIKPMSLREGLKSALKNCRKSDTAK